MHYKKNFRNKVHSTSFYIDEKILENLSFIAQLEGQSRSVIVERGLLFLFLGGDNAHWEKSKRVYAKEKKFTLHKGICKKINKESKAKNISKNSLICLAIDNFMRKYRQENLFFYYYGTQF